MGEVELRDSYAIFGEPLRNFKKSLNLDLKLDKECQEYEFMSETILNKFLNNGYFLSIKQLFES